MAYILYIPNPECGPTAYTQRSFETLKDLARWSMDQALESSVVPVPAQVLHDADIVPHQSTPLEELDVPDEEVAATPIQEKKPISYYINPLCTDYDTNSTTRELDDLIVNQDWAAVAEHYRKAIPITQYIYGTGNNRNNILVKHEVEFMTKLIYRQTTLVSPNILWKYDINKFDPSVETHLLSFMNESLTSVLHSSNAFLNDSLRIYKILHYFSYHSSWYWMDTKTTNLPAFMNTLEKMSSDDIMNICLSWIRNEKPSDYIRELILSLYTLQYYSYNSTTTSGGVGSNKYLTSYLSESSSESPTESTSSITIGKSYTSLPVEFRVWAADGVTYSTCTTALEKIGITKVRRSEGQRYIYISDISGYPSYTDYHCLRYVSWKQKEDDMTLLSESTTGYLSGYSDCDQIAGYLHPYTTENELPTGCTWDAQRIESHSTRTPRGATV